MISPVDYVLTDGIGIISVDNPPVNALSHAVRQGLMDAITEAQNDASEAVLIICRGRTFFAGADISEFGKPLKDPWLPALLDTIESTEKIVVAAIHGTALGGGFETAISCHYRCAVPAAKVGFPEVKLGLLPGAGGTQRSPRLAGIEAALELMTSGAPISAARAKDLGLIDEIVDGDLRDAGLSYVRKLLDSEAPVRRTSEIDAPGDGDFDALRAAVAKRARGQVAPLAIVDCVEATTTMPFADGMKLERKKFAGLMQGEQSAALRHFFFAERQAAKVEGLAKDTPVRDVNSVGIVGGGTMGGGIAMSFANAGIPVTMVEISDEALERGLSIIERNYAGSVKRGKLSEERAAQCRALIIGSTVYAALGELDMVIEAVFEDPGLKKKIFARQDGVCKQGSILATNTSY